MFRVLNQSNTENIIYIQGARGSGCNEPFASIVFQNYDSGIGDTLDIASLSTVYDNGTGNIIFKTRSVDTSNMIENMKILNSGNVIIPGLITSNIEVSGGSASINILSTTSGSSNSSLNIESVYGLPYISLKQSSNNNMNGDFKFYQTSNSGAYIENSNNIFILSHNNVFVGDMGVVGGNVRSKLDVDGDIRAKNFKKIMKGFSNDSIGYIDVSWLDSGGGNIIIETIQTANVSGLFGTKKQLHQCILSNGSIISQTGLALGDVDVFRGLFLSFSNTGSNSFRVNSLLSNIDINIGNSNGIIYHGLTLDVICDGGSGVWLV